jgi:amino acid adenylation domain-containing protein
MSTRLLQHLVSAQAARRPDAPAVVSSGVALTYGELESRSNQMARLLREIGCRRGDRVCLLSPKTPAALAAIVGIYKADCTYVPLDPASPGARLFKIVHACEPKAVLASVSTARLLDEICAIGEPAPVLNGGRSTCVVSLEDARIAGQHFRTSFTAADLARQATDAVPAHNTEADAAHILFTSGSTGQPKGVLITHANVLHFVRWANECFGVGPDDRLSGHSPLAFDLSVYDIFGAFAAGASLHPVPAELNVFPNKLAEFIRSRELTQWFSAPSVLSYMAQLDVLSRDDFPSLRRVIWCGEVFPVPALRYWMTHVPHAEFTNLYGPTETTIASSYYRVREMPAADAGPVPIGRACPGEALYLVDADLRPVPPGEVGEICIGGAGISPGYWRAPELTRAAFVQHPRSSDPADLVYRTGDLGRLDANGDMHFIGRRDTQIKSRGHRIELGEIEAALQMLPMLRDAAVVAVSTDGFGGTVLCCAYVPRPGAQVTPALLRQQLSVLVPSYMLPSQWKVFDRLPLNGNGKTDRGQLRQRFLEGAERAALTH